MNLLTRLILFGTPGFRWLVYEHCSTGNRQLRHADPGKGNPQMPRGWVLINTTVHNPAWNTPAKVYNNTRFFP